MSKLLSQVMKDAGKSTETFASSNGSQLLLLPYGARVLGLFAAGDDRNFFWTNTTLENAESARKMFADEAWHNTGGDRTWIAPEWDTFFSDAASTEYWQPRQLDMSDYAVERTGGGIQMSREMTLHLARPNRDAALRLTKWFGPAENPLRHDRETASVAESVQYAGYTQRVTLESLDASDTPPSVGVWNLMQLPIGGDMLVPLYSSLVPQKCFGDLPNDRMTIGDRMLRIKVDFPGSHKIALKAASLCGRTGYVYRQGESYSLVIRNFFVDPSGDYIDVQRHAPDDFGYAFQMCRVDEPAFGNFCEMEYHAPALGALPDPTRGMDISKVWAFRGSHEAINLVAQRLLGATR